MRKCYLFPLTLFLLTFVKPGHCQLWSSFEDGKELFNNNCASCHAINERIVGPALVGIKDRIPEDLLEAFIINSDSVLIRKDEYFIELKEEYNDFSHPKYPQLSISELQAILDYIDLYSRAPGSTGGPPLPSMGKPPAGSADEGGPPPIIKPPVGTTKTEQSISVGTTGTTKPAVPGPHIDFVDVDSVRFYFVVDSVMYVDSPSYTGVLMLSSSVELLRKELENIRNSNTGPLKQITDDLKKHKYFDAELIDADAANATFRITEIGDVNFIKVEEEEVLTWKWNIVPLRSNPHGKIILTVFFSDTPIQLLGSVKRKIYSNREYQVVVIAKEPGFWDMVISFFVTEERWQWFAGSIILPVGGWLFQKIRKKKKAKKKTKKDKADL